jgi:hypothetical protein
MSQRALCPIFGVELTNGANRVFDDGSITNAPKKSANVIKVLAGTGNLVFVWENGASTTYTGLAVGDELLGHFKQVTAAGTGITSFRVEWLP